MKVFSKKKGFTIVELVIVIAVIGILTAILVPTFVNLTNKANKAADESLVTSLNKALAIEENEPGNEKNVTMHNAVLDLENEGYKLSQLVTKSGQDLVWSMDENRFHLDDGSYSGANFWKIYHKAADIDGKFSAYAGHDWPEADASVTLEKTGFDVGFNEGIAKVVFDHSTGTSAVDVTIRTNSVSAETSDANLTVNAFTDATSSDTIRHYGLAGYVHVIQGGAHSFHAHSTIGFAKVEKGRFVADAGAVVKQAYVTDPEALLTKEGNGVYENVPYAATEAIKDGHAGVPLQYDSEATEEGIKEAGIEEVTPAPEVEGDPIENFDDLKAAFAEAGSHAYYFADDILMAEAISCAVETINLTIDLNGHKWEIGDGVEVIEAGDVNGIVCLSKPGQKLTIKDSAGTGLVVYQNPGNHVDAVFAIAGRATLDIQGGSFVSVSDMLFGGVAFNFRYGGGSIYGYLGTIANSTLQIDAPVTLKITNDMLPFSFLGNTVTVGEGLTKTETSEGNYTVITVTAI